MKKIISLGVASAICALTAISASAANAAAASFNQKGELKKGETVTIEVVAGQDTTGFACRVDVEGLEVETIANGDPNLVQDKYYDAQKLYTISNGDGVKVADAGKVIFTITAKVTADAGKDISVALVDTSADGKYSKFLPDQAFKATVKGAEENPGDSKTEDSNTESGDSKTEDSKTESGDSKTEDSKTESGDSKPAGDKDNPGTGVALAVVPAVLAAAGVIVAKKRK